MKRNNKMLFTSILTIAILLAPVASANGNDTEKIKELDFRLQKNVENYNMIVTDNNSSYEDVLICTDQLYQIIDELNNLGMDVESIQTSNVTIVSENKVLPATMSVRIVPLKEKSGHISATANESQLKKLNEISGQDMSVGEFMEEVFPDVQAKTPKDIVELDYKTKMVWPTPTLPAAKLFPKVKIEIPSHIAFAQSSLYANSAPEAEFSSTTFMFYPTPLTTVPYMKVLSYLYYPAGDEYIDAAIDEDTWCYSVEAEDSAIVEDTGYYCTVGSHYITFISGNPYKYVASNSGELYIDF
ncbi:hypothetical protein MSSIT_0889 [Methanosarcina siciliae T4/M]|uniref:Uncharacterized protein n=2 Tax=Methanosarcina siciliae TaxID=38027 RepID=A0A0E3PBD0_9EURY|nr:hypothetical protein [Methanosarcina siciliae]AKB27608.1 hypothetical protein MSSIT_0889 [Methanosarcina siciliae T4/M]AKB31545.1 hypothetical protein MSSIH_0855 [Methanosarcina siciliae HI350]